MTDVNKGKSVRATALIAGTDYVMTTWTKKKTHSLVTFLGYMNANGLDIPIPQLKTLTADNTFHFLSNGEALVADGRAAGAVHTGEGNGVRVTFSAVATETAPEAIVVSAEVEAPAAELIDA